MPTTYPKCSPSEMMGLLVLLKEYKGTEEIARLGDDLDLEIDEILPSLDYAEALGLVRVGDGRMTFTETGRLLLDASIRDRKTILRDQLRRTTLFKTLLRALEGAPEQRLSEEDVQRLLAFTTAPSDLLVQNIINWGRYAGLFRYDSDEHVLLPIRSRVSGRTPPSSPPGPSASSAFSPASGVARGTPGEDAPREQAAPLGHPPELLRPIDRRRAGGGPSAHAL